MLVLTFAYAASTSPSPAPLLGLLAAAVGAFVARRTGAADALGVTASASRYPHALSSSAPQPPFVFAAGDVDLLIRTKRHGFVVEIKSRHVWDGSRHNRAAVDQAKTLLRAFADTESRAWQAVV